MKLLLLVQREADTDPCWVIDACDEYAIEEWNGALPGPLQKHLDADPKNTRTLWVEIPDGSLERAFQTPTVTGTVVDGP